MNKKQFVENFCEFLTDRRGKLDLRWKIYNLAFWLFGKTPLWPALGYIIWT